MHLELILFTFGLFIFAINDILRKIVPNLWLIICVVFWVIYQIFCNWQDFRNVLPAVLILVTFSLISLISNAKFGMGDAKLISVMMIYFGVINALFSVFIGALFVCIWGIFLLLFDKKNTFHELTFPFVPFLLIGEIIALIIV